MIRKLLVLCICILGYSSVRAQDIIPKPLSAELLSEMFLMPEEVDIYYCSAEDCPLAEYLAGELSGLWGIGSMRFMCPEGLHPRGSLSLVRSGEEHYPAEGYRLSVGRNGITIEAGEYGGIFNGIQTLLQLLSPESTARAVPGCIIDDAPLFEYRAMHLDVARTFSTKEEVMRFVDLFSRYKINKFHWHLTDDEGWRIDIESRPELARVGGFRGGDSPVMAVYGEWNKKYGGYYTHDDIREVVEFAARRNVEIIPEIDLPGHSRTAGKVYPEILCAGRPNTTASRGYDRRDVWCVAREENYEILDDILREVCELFPSRYIHVGGDEVVMSSWNACPSCRALMKEKGLSSGAQLQAHFMNRLEEILARYGRTAAVWNEAIEGGTLSDSARVHGWTGVKAAREAADKGYPTVVMPAGYFYFDMRQAPWDPGMEWGGIFTYEKVYSFSFPRSGFTEKEMENVIGVEAAFWAEVYLEHDRDYLYRMTYPRICALSEVAWTPEEGRNTADFTARLERSHYDRLERLGVDYYRPTPEPPKESLLKPSVTFTSSMEDKASNPFSVLTEYRYGRSAVTTRTCIPGDHLTFTFDEGVDCDRIEFTSGYRHVRRHIIPFGYAEVAYADDPDEFVRCGELENGYITVRPEKAVKTLRIVSTTKRNGESSVIVQPLRIVGRRSTEL